LLGAQSDRLASRRVGGETKKALHDVRREAGQPHGALAMSPDGVEGAASRYALQTFTTDNLGDEIQSIAAAQFLPSIDLLIDRDALGRGAAGLASPHKIIMNGWYTHRPEDWPPSPYLQPLLTSFHLSREIARNNVGGLSAAQVLLQGENLEFFRSHEPIGARDLSTRELLLDAGVEAFFSGCLTLTLGDGVASERGDYVCAVDLPRPLLRRLRAQLKSPLIVGTHGAVTSDAFGERVHAASRRLSRYAYAKSVVTTRLSCALPCLALGTPVLFVMSARDSYRFSGLNGLLHACFPQQFLDGAMTFDPDEPPPNRDAYRVHREALIQSVGRFVDAAAGSSDAAPFPFRPEPLSDELVSPDPAVREGGRDSPFEDMFAPGRDYGPDSRPDFLRDLGKVHAAMGDLAEAERLLQFASDERPHGAYIRNLLGEIKASRLADTGAAGPPKARELRPLGAEVLAKRLTYLDKSRLVSLFEQISQVKARRVEGDFVECGVALGGAAICIASQLDGGRRFIGFDVFGSAPPPAEIDGTRAAERYQTIAAGEASGIGGDKYFGYEDDLLEVARLNFGRFSLRVDDSRVRLVKGLFTETLDEAIGAPIAFAHIDCDWHDPVRFCLERLTARLVRYGVIIVDDYNDWDGCRRAVDEFRATRGDLMLVASRPHAALIKL
jgi:O-methyltransferase